MNRLLRMLPAAALFTVAAPASAPAQSPVTGTWTTEFELGMRNENGNVTSMGTGKARITLEAKGDSVFGTWLTLAPVPPAGAPAPAPRPLKGVFANGVLKLESAPMEQRIRLNDEPMTVKMVTHYELKLEGDALTGTSRGVALGGEIEPPARPFKATRDRG